MSAGDLPEFTPPETQPEIPPGAKTVTLRCGVCFDGTLNNRTNINQRLIAASDDKLTGEERKAAAELKAKASPAEIEQAKAIYQHYGAKRPDDENSYEGFYTNVEKMERYLDAGQGKTDCDVSFKLYVEGIGTLDQEADRQGGYAFGAWKAGIPRKVAFAMGELVKQITAQDDIKKAAIAQLTVDVLGFSRGAAAARNFIYEASNDDLGQKTTASLQQRLQREMRHSVPAVFQFAGLFDTVSTYGPGIVGAIKVALGSADNVEDLNLDAVATAKTALHLTAADEYRYHFSLTDIRSAESQGHEYALPGVHSDIGGGYRDESFERVVLHGAGGLTDIILRDNYVSLKAAEAEREALITAGYCREDEITLTPQLDTEGNVLYAILTSHRRGKQKTQSAAPVESNAVARAVHDTASIKDPVKRQAAIQQALADAAYEGVRNGYSKIPLNIMVGEMRKQGWAFIGKFEDDESVPDDLQPIYQRLTAYCTGASKTDPEVWRHNQEPWLKNLRRDDLHLSARMRPGHDPRIEEGHPKRKVYPG